LTPRLFIAAILSQYGSIVAKKITDAATKLIDSDIRLEYMTENAHGETNHEETNHDKTKHQTADERTKHNETTTEIHLLNKKLIKMNQDLTGTRSTMHYLAESAHVLVKKITTFEDYVIARLDDWKKDCSGGDGSGGDGSGGDGSGGDGSGGDGSGVQLRSLEALKKVFPHLDSCKEKIRDNDKLVMVKKSMWQYKTDIKSLQQHIDINVGMVSYSSICLGIKNEHESNIFSFAGT
jgi:hypothetical protein